MEWSDKNHFLCTLCSSFYQKHYYLDNIYYQEVHRAT